MVSIHPRQFIDGIDGTGINPSVVIENEENTYYRREGWSSK